MLLNITQDGIVNAIIIFIIIILSIDIHEFAHALTAYLRGDLTAKVNGRLSLNPLVHIDPMGLIFMLFANFGWGKPTPVNESNLENPKIDSILVSLAGPFSNLVVAVILSLVVKLTFNYYTLPYMGVIIYILIVAISINVGLAIFNLLPIPPLDGSRLYIKFLPHELQFKISLIPLENYLPFFLIIAVLPLIGGRSLISFIISPLITSITSVLLGKL